MFNTIFSKYFAVCAAIVMITITVLSSVLLFFSMNFYKQDKKVTMQKNLSVAQAITKAELENIGLGAMGAQGLYNSYVILGRANNSTIFFTDVQGKTLLCSESNSDLYKNKQIAGSVLKRISESGDFFEMGKLGGFYNDPFYVVADPVLLPDGRTAGYIFVSTSTDHLRVFLKDIVRMFLFVSAIVLIVSFVVVYYMASRITRPLRLISSAAQSFGKGDFSVRVPVSGDDELTRLSASFNEMADGLASTENSRRSFIANISHELKTPMTTIGGFVDGMIDGTIEEDKRPEYLQTVSSEIHRLSRLIGSMLDLSRIDAGTLRLTRSHFDIREKLLQIAFAFEKRIEEKQLELEGLDGEKFFVTADADMIYRVLYNLIDNAVKFTPDGGTISFFLLQGENSITVRIRNTGEGLMESEIPLLFDRFYKGDKSRSGDKSGVGLGLYIVKTIIQAHGGIVGVNSQLSEYTEFYFTLPVLKSPKRAKGTVVIQKEASSANQEETV